MRELEHQLTIDHRKKVEMVVRIEAGHRSAVTTTAGASFFFFFFFFFTIGITCTGFRRAATLGFVLQLGTVVQQDVCHFRMAVLTRVRQRGIARLRLGVYVCTVLQQKAHKIDMTLLGSFH
uniref:Uncharacterized protein n=1 Tax=Anopheles merus TaxID=30066 RepID=A0A182VFX3_ANOME